MKKLLLKCCAALLAVSLLSGVLPVVSAASDNELVLTKIGHTSSDTISIAAATTRSVTLTVPYSFSGSMLDLSSGLIVEKASSIDSVITIFGSGSIASVGETVADAVPVTMSVTYYKGANTTVHYTTDYDIRVVRGEKKSPSFTGTITKSVTGLISGTKINDIVFSANDFTPLYTSNDSGALSHIAITGSSLSCGSLKLGSGNSYAGYTSGGLISINDIGNLVFDATGSGTVSYIVTAYAGNDTGIAIGSVILSITVTSITAPTISGTLSKSVSAGSTCTFSLTDFSSLFNLKSGTLNTIDITPGETSCGIWYNGSSAFTGTASFTADTIGNLKFTGSTAGTAAFTWKVSNEAGFSEPGSGSVTVKTASVPTIISTVVKSVSCGATLTFSLSDFISNCNLNNGTLGTIVITPSNSGYGTWYKGSSTFSGSKTFDANDIGTLKFKAALCGQAHFTWKVSNEKGTSAAGDGLITVNAVTTTITYTTGLNTAKSFSASDFNAACRDATGANLSYVYFSLPSTAFGTLNYGFSSSSSPGTAVAVNTVYYYSHSPKLSNVSFVPAANYSGTFTIFYTGVDTNGVSYTGNIIMTVGSPGDLSYFTPQNTARTFGATEFNTACANMTGSGLSYVYFMVPSAVYGKLYFGYASPSNTGTAISANTPYALQSLSSITFVPAANYSGSVSIQYTGITVNSVSYTGNVNITVGGNGTVSYTTNKELVKIFSGADFNAACIDATGAALSYIILSPPAGSGGTLYYNYSSLSSPGTQLTSNTVLYMSGTPGISSTAFLPAANYSGTVSIPYTGFSVNGAIYAGKIVIQVNAKACSAYFTDIGAVYDWAAAAIDRLYENGIVNGIGASQYSPGTIMTRGDFMLMLYRAMGYSGSTKSNFSDVPKGSYYYDAIAIAKDLGIAKGSNNKFSPDSPLIRQDAIVFVYRALTLTGVQLTPGSGSDIAGFTDKGKVSKYALTAVQTLVKAGLIKGSGNKLNPASTLSRAEMAVVLYRVIAAY